MVTKIFDLSCNMQTATAAARQTPALSDELQVTSHDRKMATQIFAFKATSRKIETICECCHRMAVGTCMGRPLKISGGLRCRFLEHSYVRTLIYNVSCERYPKQHVKQKCPLILGTQVSQARGFLQLVQSLWTVHARMMTINQSTNFRRRFAT